MLKKYLPLLVVVIAGEAIFMHPFLIPRLFRPLMMEAWGINNTDIGLAFSAYGLTAMVSYLFGGPFADKYEPRKLIAISLIVTALGSSILILSPNSLSLIAAYAFFGVSTILLMWSAMIKVTHEIGGQSSRATAMGILDGGRGLSAAIVVSLLMLLLQAQSHSGVIKNKVDSLNSIYLALAFFLLLVSVIVWFFLKNVETQEAKKHDWSFSKAKTLIKRSDLWLLSLIILSAYCGYKNVGNYSVYLKNIQGASLIESSQFTSYIFWTRPLSAFMAGVFADQLHVRFKGGRFITLFILFSFAAATQFLLAFHYFSKHYLMLINILLTSSFAYALRAVYFSVFGEFKIQENMIGTTVGIVSVLGYLPDFFFGTFTGHLIDHYPGELGFTYTFSFTGLLLIFGSLSSLVCFFKQR